MPYITCCQGDSALLNFLKEKWGELVDKQMDEMTCFLTLQIHVYTTIRTSNENYQTEY
jgi:hypothetical protein